MKTAISLPDDLFRRIDEAAGDRGISRSRLVATAAEAYLDAAEQESLSREVDDALRLAQDDGSNAAAAAHGRARLAADDVDW